MTISTINARALVDALKRCELVRENTYVAHSHVVLKFGAAATLMAIDQDMWLVQELECSSSGTLTTAIYPPNVIAAFGNASGTLQIEQRYDDVAFTSGGVELTTPSDYPVDAIPRPEWRKTVAEIEMTEAHLRRDIGQVIFAISGEETRYYLNGAYLTSEDGQAVLVATDGHQLARRRMQRNYTGPGVIVHRRALNTLMRLLRSNSDGPVRLSVRIKQHGAGVGGQDTHIVTVEAGNWRLHVSCIDGKFPGYQRVIPTDEPTISARVTQAAISRAPALSENSPFHDVEIDGEARLLTVKNSDGSTVTMPIDATGGAVHFNLRRLKPIVGALGGVHLKGGGPEEPFWATKDDGRTLVVMMPMKSSST